MSGGESTKCDVLVHWIVKAGCHPVAIAHVVELGSLSQRPSAQSQVAAGFFAFSLPKPYMYMYM